MISSLFLKPVTREEVLSIIMDLKVNKSPGIDQLKAETLKEIREQIIDPLVFLINKIFSTGVCPSEFKIAVVTPIHKKGKTYLLYNYRPISIITSMAKIFEKCLRKRLNDFFNKHDIISDYQFTSSERAAPQIMQFQK